MKSLEAAFRRGPRSSIGNSGAADNRTVCLRDCMWPVLVL
jgi:hypothetical protein